MNRYTKSNILVRGLHLFVIAFLLVGAFILTPERAAQAATPTEPSDLLQFTAAGHVLGFQAEGVYVAAGDHMLRVEFVSASGIAPVTDQIPSGDGQAQPLGQVTYTDLWPGISLSYEHVAGGIVRSSYLLEPGADVGQIQLCYNSPVDIKAGGSLRIVLETGQMRESAPVAWQDINGQRIPVDVTFCLLDSPIRNPVVSFGLGQYNPSYPLMIDPTLQWNTFMGSSSCDSGSAIAVDGSGNVYVAGNSTATWGSPMNAHAGGSEAFAAKLDSSSGSLQWNTFMGSSSGDSGSAIAVDGSWNVYLTGSSEATWGSPMNAHAGDWDAFVAKLLCGMVTDNNTGLMCQQDEAGFMNWEGAISYCEGLSQAGYTDWRLPNIKELESISDDTFYNPAIDTNFFPGAFALGYWSSTTDAGSSSYAWRVFFNDGRVDSVDKSEDHYVRCVRGGQ